MSKIWSLGASALAVGLMTSTPASAITIYYTVPKPALNQWVNISAPLSAGSWRLNDYSSATLATNAEVQYVLTNLIGLYLITEWNTGADDTNVDNVAFGSGASSNFAANNQGWRAANIDPTFDVATQTVSSTSAPWDASGSLRVTDIYPWTYVSAPASYLGNQSARFGETLSADFFFRTGDNASYAAFALVGSNTPLPTPGPGALATLGLGLLGFGAFKMRQAVR